MTKSQSTILCVALCAASCTATAPLAMTNEEIALIKNSHQTMRVLTVNSDEDSLFLRKQSMEMDVSDLGTPDYEALTQKMITTLIQEEGVGIAGPQVGLSRRIIAVQRFDKDGEPIEIYVNPSIVETRGELLAGPEGCLSVPQKRGEVRRWQDITIEYLDPENGWSKTREDIKGFTAVIFQHETDHLDGTLYTDKLVPSE